MTVMAGLSVSGSCKFIYLFSLNDALNGAHLCDEQRGAHLSPRGDECLPYGEQRHGALSRETLQASGLPQRVSVLLSVWGWQQV